MEMGNSKIIVIPNKYKDTLDDFIYSSNPKSSDLARPINERFNNIFISKNNLADFSKENYFDENLPNLSLRLMPKI